MIHRRRQIGPGFDQSSVEIKKNSIHLQIPQIRKNGFILTCLKSISNTGSER
jgi:hypothetical protein